MVEQVLVSLRSACPIPPRLSPYAEPAQEWLLDRLPRLGGLAARPGSSGRSQPGRMDLGRLGPRPPAGPYRPWFTGSPDEPWFGGSADDPWFTRSNDP